MVPKSDRYRCISISVLPEPAGAHKQKLCLGSIAIKREFESADLISYPPDELIRQMESKAQVSHETRDSSIFFWSLMKSLSKFRIVSFQFFVWESQFISLLIVRRVFGSKFTTPLSACLISPFILQLSFLTSAKPIPSLLDKNAA